MIRAGLGAIPITSLRLLYGDAWPKAKEKGRAADAGFLRRAGAAQNREELLCRLVLIYHEAWFVQTGRLVRTL